jgi:hypothetical protein
MLADGCLGSLIVFAAPILAVPECLAAYRFSGKNGFHADEFEVSAEILKNRLQLFQIVIDAIRKWLNENGYSREAATRAIFP